MFDGQRSQEGKEAKRDRSTEGVLSRDDGIGWGTGAGVDCVRDGGDVGWSAAEHEKAAWADSEGDGLATSGYLARGRGR